MNTVTECPSCHAPITLGRVLRAPTPFHLSCGKCGARLRVRGPLVPIGLVVALALGLGFWTLMRRFGVVAMLGPVVGITLVVEIVASLAVVNARLDVG